MKQLLILLMCTNVIFSMEHPDTFHEPIVVNYNDGDLLPEEVTSAVIFSSTPRISRFDKFTELAAHDIGEILKSKPKGMRKDLRKLKQEKQDTLSKMEQYFKADRHSDTALQCFFDHGINRKLLADNMDSLMKNVNHCPNAENLIHLFLPIYFNHDDFDGISQQERQSLLARFLRYSAQFYQQMYQEQKPKQAVYIVIPPLEDFADLSRAQEDTPEKDAKGKGDDIVANILKTRLFDKGIKKATLLNPSERQLVEFGKRFQKMGYSSDDIPLVKFTIYTGRFKESKVFVPYTIPTEKVPSSLLSCVVSPELVETFEQLEKKNE